MYAHGAHWHAKNLGCRIQDGRLAAILNAKIMLFDYSTGKFSYPYGADILHVDVALWYLKKIMKGRCRQIQIGRSAAIYVVMPISKMHQNRHFWRFCPNCMS